MVTAVSLERRLAPYISTAALAATYAELNDLHFSRPLAALAKLHDLPGIKDSDPLAAFAIHPQHMTVARVVANRFKTLAAHGILERIKNQFAILVYSFAHS